jgi:hypothetical protein
MGAARRAKNRLRLVRRKTELLEKAAAFPALEFINGHQPVTSASEITDYYKVKICDFKSAPIPAGGV